MYTKNIDTKRYSEMFKVYIKRYKTQSGKERFSFYSEATGKIITIGVKFLPNVFVYTGDSFYMMERSHMEALVEASFKEARFWEYQKNYKLFKDIKAYHRGIRHSKAKKRQRVSD